MDRRRFAMQRERRATSLSARFIELPTPWPWPWPTGAEQNGLGLFIIASLNSKL
jgi:hypothetical protein